MSYNFTYSHESFNLTIDFVPIFKHSDDRLLLIEVEVFKRIWGTTPGFITMHVFEPNFKIGCLLHDYLAERKGLENTAFRITRNLLINSAGMLIHYDSILDLMDECRRMYIVNPFDGDERFIPVGCGNDRERSILWEA
jgi:hypothetical protein